jgi:hypothetical protein
VALPRLKDRKKTLEKNAGGGGAVNLGKTFHINHMGTFYYDPETNEVTIRVEYEATVIHEWRLEATVMIRQFSEAIPEIVEVIIKEAEP